MDLLYLSFWASVFCIIFILSLRYLSLLRWFSGQAYVLTKKKERFSVLEVLELFKNAKPFPVSYQKGWKINTFVHGHRVWFNFLTFTASPNAPCIKVYAAFDKINTSSQSLLQLIKATSHICAWKPGVIAASSVHEVTSHAVNGGVKELPSLPVQHDFIREEHVLPPRYHWLQLQTDTTDVIHTVIEEFKRYWHKEDNGCSWMLQMSEASQSLIFYLIQPVSELDQCLLTVVTWSAPWVEPRIPASEIPSVLLSSLSEHIQLRRVQMTPLLNISLPHHMMPEASHTMSDNPVESHRTSILQRIPFISSILYMLGYGSNPSGDPESRLYYSDSIKRSSSILRYHSGGGSLRSRCSVGTGENQPIKEENEAESDTEESSPEVKENIVSSEVGEARESQEYSGSSVLHEGKKSPLLRSNSDGARSSPSHQIIPQNLETERKIARYKTMVNQAAAELMAEAIRASNIDLEKSVELQAESSNGWTFVEFQNNIVILKKISSSGSCVQSYLGKGFVLAPPKTVWDAIRNPRTRFTYDESLKKVDILETITDGIKIVYLYQEVLQLLRKECCDVCCLQGERIEGSKYVLAYTSVEHPSATIMENVIRGNMLSSGWIIEPVKKDDKVYSLVTYLMQVDFGPARPGYERLPLEDMMSHQPFSISLLQQYLKPAVQLARRKCSFEGDSSVVHLRWSSDPSVVQ